jgi:hypothetical protein
LASDVTSFGLLVGFLDVPRDAPNGRGGDPCWGHTAALP